MTRAGSMVGFVGVPHGVELPIRELFDRNVGVHGGMAPVRRYLRGLIERVWERRMEPGRVFDLVLPLDQASDAYAAMDERRVVKVLLRP